MKEIFMEEVNSTVSAIMEIINVTINEKLGEEKEDVLFGSIQAEIDKLCNFPEYRSYN